MKSMDDWRRVAQVNRMIRKLAMEITESESDVRFVYVLSCSCACSRVWVWEAHELSAWKMLRI